jgi:N-acetylmuramoyl-L-alanine amidase
MRSKLFIAIVLFSLTSTAVALPIVVIDAGHETARPGAIGTCGKTEVAYNDEMVQQIAHSLKKSYQIILTRQAGSDVATDIPDLQRHIPQQQRTSWDSHKSLLARPALANLHHAQVFISIHHDSTSAEQQINDPTLCDHQGGKNLKEDFKNKYQIGYNIFINNTESSKRKENSLLLAENIGKQLRALGRVPSNYHRYPIDACKSCYPVNAKIGVWHEDLAVLRNTNMPAILIEVGNIVDPNDEKIINTEAFRKQFSHALKQGLDDYFRTLKNGHGTTTVSI